MKKIISLIIAVIIVLSEITAANAAFGSENMQSNDYNNFEYGKSLLFDGTVSVDITQFHPTVIKTKSQPVEYRYNYRNQLTEYGKSVYDAKLENVNLMRKGIKTMFSIPVLPNIKVTSEANIKKLANEVFTAAFAFDNDHPELFWIAKAVSFGYNYDHNTNIITELYFIQYNNTWWCDYYTSESQIRADERIFNNKVEEITNECSKLAQYSKIKYIHDYIAQVSTYNPIIAKYGESAVNQVSEMPWSAISAIIPMENDKDMPVCEAYAKAFKVLCDAANIDCIIVSGESGGVAHAWNIVKMHNEKWFYIDVTFDDTASYYKYFLVGSTSMAANHTVDLTIASYSTMKFTIPEANLKSYPQHVGDSLGDCNSDGTINTNDAVTILKHCSDFEQIPGSKKNSADFNIDGTINTADCVSLLKFLAEA